MGLCWLLWWFCLNFSFILGQFLFEFFYTPGDCFIICPFSGICDLVEHAIALIVLYASIAHKENVLANFLDAICSLFAHSSAAGCEMHLVTAKDTLKGSFEVADWAFASFAVAFTTNMGKLFNRCVSWKQQVKSFLNV